MTDKKFSVYKKIKYAVIVLVLALNYKNIKNSIFSVDK